MILTVTPMRKKIRQRPAAIVPVSLTAIVILAIFLTSCVTVTRIEPAKPVVNADLLAFSPDGSILAALDRHRVRLWDVKTWSERPPLEEARPTGPLVCFSPDGQMVAVNAGIPGTATNGIEVFRVSTGTRVASLKVPRGKAISSMSFSRNGTTIVYVETGLTGANRPPMWVGEWDFSSGKILWTEGSIEIRYKSAGLSPDGRLLAFVRSGVDRLVLWDTTSRRLRATTEEGVTPGYQEAPIFSPDGKRIALLYRSSGFVVDTVSGKVVQKLAYQDVDQPKLAAAFSPDGQILAIALPGEGVQLLDTATGKTISSVRESDFPVFTNLDVASRLAFSPDGRRLFFSARGNGIREWDVTRLTGSGATG